MPARVASPLRRTCGVDLGVEAALSVAQRRDHIVRVVVGELQAQVLCVLVVVVADADRQHVQLRARRHDTVGAEWTASRISR